MYDPAHEFFSIHISAFQPAITAVTIHDHIWSDMYKMVKFYRCLLVPTDWPFFKHPQDRVPSKDEVIQQIGYNYTIIPYANGIDICTRK